MCWLAWRRTRAEAAEGLRRMVAEGRAGTAEGGGRSVVVRCGRDERDCQRRLCRGCVRSFTASKLRPVSWSKLEPRQWEELAACMAGAAPLRVVAERCSAILPAARFMRLRACEAMAGASVERVCVLAGENSLGDVFADVWCRGRATEARVREMLEGRIGDCAALITDVHWARAGAERTLGDGAVHLAYRSGEAANAALSGWTRRDGRLKDFLGRMGGASTGRLPLCPAWFCRLERKRRAGSGAREAVRDLCLSGRHRTTRRALFAVPRYDMGYWERGGRRGASLISNVD